MRRHVQFSWLLHGRGPGAEPLLPTVADEGLDELGIERDEAFDALARARDIRDRYTVLDLAFELGFFPGGIRQVILTAGV